MEFLIPLKDIVIGPGKRFDPSTGSEEDVIALIKKTYREKKGSALDTGQEEKRRSDSSNWVDN
jgi:hypothetical protein